MWQETCCAAGFRCGLCRLRVKTGKSQIEYNNAALHSKADVGVGSRRGRSDARRSFFELTSSTMCGSRRWRESAACQWVISRTPLGVAPHQWLTEQRIALSKEKLRDDGLSLSDVATVWLQRSKSFHAALHPHCWRKSGRVASGAQGIASEQGFLRILQAVLSKQRVG